MGVLSVVGLALLQLVGVLSQNGGTNTLNFGPAMNDMLQGALLTSALPGSLVPGVSEGTLVNGVQRMNEIPLEIPRNDMSQGNVLPQQDNAWIGSGFSSESFPSMLPAGGRPIDPQPSTANSEQIALVGRDGDGFTTTEFLIPPGATQQIVSPNSLSNTAINVPVDVPTTQNNVQNVPSQLDLVSPQPTRQTVQFANEAPSQNDTGMTFQSAFPGLPSVNIPDYGDDSWFTYLKAVLDRAMPNPPPLMRNSAPIAEPVPRRLSDLPRGSSPIYLINVRGGPAYVPFVIPNQLHPIYIPFSRETRELMYPYLPLYLPYPDAGLNREDIGMRFVAYIPFQPDRFRNSREGAPLLYPQVTSGLEFPLYVDYRPATSPITPAMAV